MSEWSDISQAIGMLGQQDVQRKQKAVYDTQLQATQQKVAEDAAISQNYDALARAFRESGGNLDALAPLVKDGPSTQAMAKFVDDYSKTEEGKKKAQDATSQRVMRDFQNASGYVSKALASPRGSEEWVANTVNAAANAPFTLKLGGYDPESQTFELLAPAPIVGFSSAGERISADQAEATLKRIQAGTIAAKDGTLFNKEWQDAHIMYDIDRKQKNTAALANTEQHILLTNGKQSLTVIPQLAENPADGFVYLVQDPQKGLVPTPNLDAYLSSGFRPISQKQANEETKIDQEQQKIGMTAWGHQISAANLGMRQKEFEHATKGQSGLKDQAGVVNTAVDNLRAQQNDILKRYVNFPAPNAGESPEAFNFRIMDAQKTAMQSLEDAAKKGDARALHDLEMLQSTMQDYNTLINKQSEIAYTMTGLPAPQRNPGAQAGVLPAAKGSADGRYKAAPAQGAQAQPTPPAQQSADQPPIQGARKGKNGDWYIEKDGKFFRVRQ